MQRCRLLAKRKISIHHQQGFQRKLVLEILKSVGVRVWGVVCVGVNSWFLLNNLSLLWLIDTKLGVWSSLCPEAAWDCYPGVCDEAHCCYK